MFLAVFFFFFFFFFFFSSKIILFHDFIIGHEELHKLYKNKYCLKQYFAFILVGLASVLVFSFS